MASKLEAKETSAYCFTCAWIPFNLVKAVQQILLQCPTLKVKETPQKWQRSMCLFKVTFPKFPLMFKLTSPTTTCFAGKSAICSTSSQFSRLICIISVIFSLLSSVEAAFLNVDMADFTSGIGGFRILGSATNQSWGVVSGAVTG